jgi:hypothetical protein
MLDLEPEQLNVEVDRHLVRAHLEMIRRRRFRLVRQGCGPEYFCIVVGENPHLVTTKTDRQRYEHRRIRQEFFPVVGSLDPVVAGNAVCIWTGRFGW